MSFAFLFLSSKKCVHTVALVRLVFYSAICVQAYSGGLEQHIQSRKSFKSWFRQLMPIEPNDEVLATQQAMPRRTIAGI